MSQEIVTRASALPASGDPSTWSDQEKAVVTAAGLVFTHQDGSMEPAPRPVVEQFLHTAQRTGLDPLARQLYCIPRYSRRKGMVEWSTQTSIDGLRVIAERHGQYGGQTPVEWLTEKGEWVDVFVKVIHGDHPLAARVGVVRKDWAQPLVAIATWESYCPTYNDKPTGLWGTMGATMIAKCAEALALRKAFPQDLSGLYTSDEMAQAASQERQVAASQPIQEAPPTPPAEEPIEATVEPSQDWIAAITDLSTVEEARALYNAAVTAGEIGLTLEVGDRQVRLDQLITEAAAALASKEEADAPTGEE